MEQMTKGNLIPFNKMDKERAREIQSMGGRTVTQQRKFAAKIREMKKKGIDDEEVSWFLQRLTDPDVNAFHIQKWLDELKEVVHPNQRVALLNVALNLYKIRFGEKHTHLNLNVDVRNTIKSLKEFLEGEDGKQKQD